jgi:hypothetical protein
MAYERFSNTQPWGWNQPVAVPRNWQTGSPHGGWAWANALLPYLRSHGQPLSQLSCSATLPRKLPNADYSQRVQSPAPVSYAYNGYLHAYLYALVDDPSLLADLLGRAGTRTLGGLRAREPDPALRPSRTDRAEFTPCQDPNTTYPLGAGAPASAVRVDPQERGSLHHAGVVAADPTVGRANRPE